MTENTKKMLLLMLIIDIQNLETVFYSKTTESMTLVQNPVRSVFVDGFMVTPGLSMIGFSKK